jgi:hypothetical protein
MKNHWVYLPMASSKAASKNSSAPSQPRHRYAHTATLKHLDENKLAAISDVAHSNLPQIAQNKAKVLGLYRHWAQSRKHRQGNAHTYRQSGR